MGILDFGMQWEGPVFKQPFELWRDEGVLHLVLASHAHLRTNEMKEMIRLIAAMDPSGGTPVLIDHAPEVVVDVDARRMLTRACKAQGHPIVVYTESAQCKRQLDLFRQVNRPAFPFAIFNTREEAFHWALERMPAHAGKSEAERP
ncbi:MAG TPA: hypothetical protein PK760_01290 [Flavobacteriales bacterium]|nr:hypothetical protein [Flavobacteriales bacterium]